MKATDPNDAVLNVQLRCACGQVRVHVQANAPVHLVCYCDDCQGYAAWLEAQRPARWGPVTAVEAQGGSRVCQVFGADVKVLTGSEQLRATVLDPALVPGGRPQEMLRIHAACCATPMFSACWRELPTIGFYAANVVAPNGLVVPDAATGCWGDDPLLGPPAYRINTKWARVSPELPPPAGAKGFPLGFLLRFILRNYILHRNCRTPYPWPLPPPGEAEERMETRATSKG